MEELTQKFRERLATRITALRAALADMDEAPEDAIATLRRIAHALHGSGGTYGFPHISDAAREVEFAPDVQLRPAVDRLLAILDVEQHGPPADSPRMLIVDDDPENVLLLKYVVGPLNVEADSAGTAAEAQRKLAEESYAMVVLDLVLPDADGRSVLLWMREQTSLADTPVLVMSGLGSTRVQAECYAIGADGFFEKPIDPDVVRAAISARIGTRSPRSSGVASAPVAESVADVAAPTGNRVVLVEDDDLVASIIRHRLSRAGFEITHYTDGVEARDSVTADGVCLAILDIKVPGIDGFELLETLRKRAEFSRVPFIILTAECSERDVVRGLKLGASDYIVKPFSPTELVARVNRLTQPS